MSAIDVEFLINIESTIDICSNNKSDSNISMLTIQFNSADSFINIYISCYRTDNFSNLEERLYKNFLN